MDLNFWQPIFQKKISEIVSSEDPAHDLLHFQRVVRMAHKLAILEKADLNVVIPAAWLHDFVIIPKDNPLRSQASRMSAEKAVEFLRSVNYPPQYYEAIGHAIETHSFSANISTKTKEAEVVQDADRLDGLGAIGIARCFATAGLMKRAFYSEEDPFCENRSPVDAKYTIDHFYQKLFKTVETLKTAAGRAEGQRRMAEMKHFLRTLQSEIGNISD